MGLIRRLKRGAGRVKKGLKHIHEEARHPGRPASYNATDNPLWADDDVVKFTTGQAPPPRAEGVDSGKTEAPGAQSVEGRTEQPWFLQGDQADSGWDGTNPGDAWSADGSSDDEESS
jgi:hypothetical protein